MTAQAPNSSGGTGPGGARVTLALPSGAQVGGVVREGVHGPALWEARA